MADPVNQDIIDELISRLENITTANGYEFDVGTVAKGDRDTDAFQPDARDIYIEQQEEIENPAYSCPGNPPRIAFDMPIAIHGYAKRLDLDEGVAAVTETSTTENQMMAAIRKAIANNDAATWHTFGGNAKHARMSAGNHFNEPSWDGATVLLTVTYRVSELDPFTVG